MLDLQGQISKFAFDLEKANAECELLRKMKDEEKSNIAGQIAKLESRVISADLELSSKQNELSASLEEKQRLQVNFIIYFLLRNCTIAYDSNSYCFKRMN